MGPSFLGKRVQGNDVITLATMEVLIIFCPFNYFALCLSKFHSQWILALSFFSRAAASLRLLYVFFSHFATICVFVTGNSLVRLLRLQPTMPLVWILCNQAICFITDLEFGMHSKNITTNHCDVISTKSLKLLTLT